MKQNPINQAISSNLTIMEMLFHPDDYSVMDHMSMYGQPKRKIARRNYDNEGQFNLFYSKDKQKEGKK